MTEEEAFRLARSRFTMLVVLRAAGVVDMIAGLVIWKSDLVRRGGWSAIGFPLFAAGFLLSLLMPMLLVRRWRSDR